MYCLPDGCDRLRDGLHRAAACELPLCALRACIEGLTREQFAIECAEAVGFSGGVPLQTADRRAFQRDRFIDMHAIGDRVEPEQLAGKAERGDAFATVR